MKPAISEENQPPSRRFDPEHIMEPKEIDELMSLAFEPPTAFNLRNWRFVVVHDKSVRTELKEASWDENQLVDASLLVILCADLKAWEEEPLRYWHSTPRPTQEYSFPPIQQYYPGLDQVQRDEAMRSCGIAAQTLMLAAKSMGYDATPLDGFDFDDVAEVINLPDDHAICMCVAIGKRLHTKEVLPENQPAYDNLVITNTFN